jgi:La-related protein 7
LPKKLVRKAFISSFAAAAMVSVDGQSPLVLLPHTTTTSSSSAASSLSAARGTTTPPMDVIRRRKTGSVAAVAPTVIMSSSSSTTTTATTGGSPVLNGKPMQLLTRSLSGSTLNAKAPEFVPKNIITSLSTSLPGGCAPQASGFGSPPTPTLMMMQAPPGSSLPPLIVVAPLLQQQAVPPSTVVLPAAWPPAGDLVSAFDDHGGAVVVGHEHDQDGVPSHGATAAAPVAAAPSQKPVVTEELKAKIVKQVEFYFSDTNLPTDNYLMKYVKRDPQGFVPIPVVASFRKIKNLVKNHGVVAAALRNSPLLVVSEDGKKVRRVHPLPEVDLEEVQARTVVAENLPADHSIETIEQLFGKVGNVKMVRICHPEAANGANQTAAKISKSEIVISNKLHALVEYETIDLAEKAVAELTDEHNWRSGLRVRLLLRRTVYAHNPSYTIMLMFPILEAKAQFIHSRCCMDFLA